MALAGERYTGASVARIEDQRVLTGAGNYIDDVRPPGLLHAAFLRSPFPHAAVDAIDVQYAATARGVVRVLTGADLEALVTPGPVGIAALMQPGVEPDHTVLATDVVRFVGDPVALVVAETRAQAEDACELIEVDYDLLDSVATVDDAMDPTRPVLFESIGSNVRHGPVTSTFGDVDDAFAKADRVVRARLAPHRQQPVPMECRGSVSSYDTTSGRLDVWISTQGVGPVHVCLAAKVGLPMENIRVRSGDVGGSFGLKIGAGREEIACAVAAIDLGAPVKWIEDRYENLVASGHAREETFDVEAAVTDEGRILGLRVEMLMDTGAYPGVSTSFPRTLVEMLPSAYAIGAFELTWTGLVTNKASYVSYRGPWASETWVRERLIDLVARELGSDPLEIRLKNVATQDTKPLKMTTGKSLAGVTIKESLDRLGEVIDIPAFRKRQDQERSTGRHLGIGIATFIEPTPGPRSGDEPVGREAMFMELSEGGEVVVFAGQMPNGQGHETSLTQIAADEFGVPMSDVRVVLGDSSSVPFGNTGGSRFATMAGGACKLNALALRKKVLELASHLLEASVSDLELVKGDVFVRGVPARALSLAEVASAAATGDGLPPHVDRTLRVEEVYDGGIGAWSGGSHCAIVEVDVETGEVHIERYVVVEDCGELINPAIVDGQIRGGVAKGIGAVLLERTAYDDTGQIQSATFLDYLLPTATDIPRIEIHHLESVLQDDLVNFRGVGEGGMIAAPAALCNAIEDALSPFGAEITEQHLPPARVLELAGTIDPEPSL